MRGKRKRIDEAEVIKALELAPKGSLQREIAGELGISQPSVSTVKRSLWGSSKCDWTGVREFAKTHNVTEIARRYGVPEVTCRAYLHKAGIKYKRKAPREMKASRCGRGVTKIPDTAANRKWLASHTVHEACERFGCESLCAYRRAKVMGVRLVRCYGGIK